MNTYLSKESRLDIEFLQKVLTKRCKPYLENLNVCITDATCISPRI